MNRTTIRRPVLLIAAVLATGCGDADTASSPTEPTPTEPSPTATVPTTTTTDPCVIGPGPITLSGTVVRVSGGIAGVDDATLHPDECSAEPIPIVNLAWDALPVASSTTDCEGCPDAMSSTRSEPVEVSGVMVAADELPGATTSPELLVLVADGRRHSPETNRYRAYDIDGITWSLRTRVVDGGDALCEPDPAQPDGCVVGTRFGIEAATGVVPPAAGTEWVRLRGTTTGDGRIVVESVAADTID